MRAMRQPNGFQRWIANHQLLYVAAFAGLVLVLLGSWFASDDASLAGMAAVMLVGSTLLAWLVAVAIRRRVRGYDARANN